jgi:hypothetical protein
MATNFSVLAAITAEPPTLPPLEHASAHVLNTPVFERKYARAYLGGGGGGGASSSGGAQAGASTGVGLGASASGMRGSMFGGNNNSVGLGMSGAGKSAFGASALSVSALNRSASPSAFSPGASASGSSGLSPAASKDLIALRTTIAAGARTALEAQYWDLVTRTLESRAVEAAVGGDPGVGARMRAWVLMRHYRGGEWEDGVEVGCLFLSLGFGVGCFVPGFWSGMRMGMGDLQLEIRRLAGLADLDETRSDKKQMMGCQTTSGEGKTPRWFRNRAIEVDFWHLGIVTKNSLLCQQDEIRRGWPEIS